MKDKKYYVIRRHKDDFIALIETLPISKYSYIQAKSFLPDVSPIFNLLTDEIAINIYEDEFGQQWEFLYSSTNKKEAIEHYYLYKSTNKYNL